MVNGHEAARSGEWAQHFSNASCSFITAFPRKDAMLSPLSLSDASTNKVYSHKLFYIQCVLLTIQST